MRKKLLLWLFSLLLIVSFASADWYYNPATGQIDYYEPVSGANFGDLANVTLAGVAIGNVLYYNGTRWVNLATGANTEVLTLAGGVPTWAAAGAPGAHAATHELLGADLVDHDNLTNFVAAEHLLVGAIDHDSLLNYVAGQHLVLPGTIVATLTDHNLAAHTALGLFDQHADVDHDQTTNFVAGEHLLVGAIDHDSLLNYVAGDHIGLPATIATVLTDHNLAAHTGLGLAIIAHAMATHSDEDTYNISTSGTAGTGEITVADGGGINLQEDITFTGATTENLIKFPDNLADALNFKEGANSYMQFVTTNDEEDIIFYKSVDILHTAMHADDHALEIDVNAANLGDVKAIDIDYITGQIDTGQDEGVILVNIDDTTADGGEVFALEVLSTDGSASKHGMKVGPEVHPVHQDSGEFINGTLGTDNTPSTNVPNMVDGILGNTTAIFTNNSEYIIIGANVAFQDMELVFSTVASKSINPTFWYSIDGGSDNFTQFTPVDGTDGCKHTGVISWDASDLVGHVADATTGKFDIKMIRTKAGAMTTPILGYAKTAATTEYVWDKEGDVSIRNLKVKASAPGVVGSHQAGQLIIQNPADDVNSNAVITGYESDGSGNPDQQLWYLGSATGADENILFLNRRNASLNLGTNNLTRVTIAAGGEMTVSQTLILSDVIDAVTDTDKFLVLDGSDNVDYRTGANVLADLSGNAGGAFAWNGQNITGLNSVYLVEQAEADADIGGSGQIWVDADNPNTLWFTDEDGTDVQLGAASTYKLKVDAGATEDYFGVAGGDGLFRFTANQFTMADGGNFVTLSLADHATARTALGLQIGADVQAWDTDLDTYAGISPSANVQTLLANATFALFMADLSGTAAAPFDWGGQNLTNIGSIAPTSIDSGGAITAASAVTIEDSNELRLADGEGDYFGLEAGAMAGNTVYVAPLAFPVTGQVLSSTDAGVMSWVNNASGSMATDALWAAQGDLAYGNADDTGVILSFNYEGDILRLNATVPYWDTPGIANTNPVVIDDDNVADDEYARFTANGLESRTAAEVLSNIGAQPLNTVLTELTNLTDPAADKFPFWNDTTNNFEFSAVIHPTATGVTVGAAGNAGKLELEDADADVLAIQVGVQAGNTTYTWPTAFGTTGFVLSSTDAGTMSWVANSSGSMATDTLWNAAGDLAYASADDTGAILAIGSAADFLRVNGGIPYWDTPGIANTNPVVIDSADAADDEYARFTANGLESRTPAELMTDLPAATTGASGKSELTTTAEVSAGVDTTRAVTADALAGSTIGRKSMVWKLTASDGVVESGDSLDSMMVPDDFAGWLVVDVLARVITVDDAADDITIDIYNVTQTADILSTAMTIDGGEASTRTAAVAWVIDLGEDDITAADVIRIDITGYAGDNAAGLEVHIVFERVT